MNPKSLPPAGSVLEMGAEDAVFDSLLLTGPILLVSIVLAGRHPVILALVSAYLLVFSSNICFHFFWGD